MDYDADEIKQAAIRLAKQEDAKAHYDALNSVITKLADVPVKLVGDAAWLNPLLAQSREEPDTYKTVVQWANAYRIKHGLTPLIDDDKDFDKGEYMREFMAQKRERERKAVAIENAKRPTRDRLVGRSREDYQRRLASEWGRERTRRMNAAREAAGRRLTKPEMQEVLALFWRDVDAKLDAGRQ